MAKKILSLDERTEARRLYEREGWGYGRIAAKFSVSKPTVQGWAKNWQRDYGVAPLPAGKRAEEGVRPDVGNPKVTGNAGAGATQAGYAYRDGSTGAAARVVSDVFVPPTGSPGVGTVPTPSQSTAYSDEMQVPDGLDEWEREEFVKTAIVARQRAINGRHLREMQAARSKLYESLKKAGTKEGPGAALASQRNVTALLALQGGEMEAELARVKLEVHEFVGKPLKPQPCRIVVHILPGEQLVGGAKAYGQQATVVTDVIAKEIQHA
jgi:hypothetical protein